MVAEVTAHDKLLSLLGEWVTVTHPGDERRVWHGQLASMMDSPVVVLRMPEGGTEVLPQSFTVEAAAPASGGPYPDPDSPALPFTALIDSSLLWLFNRLTLHPRGLALALHVDEHSQAYGWSLVHNGEGEPWQYDPVTDNDGRARAEATISAALQDVPAPPAAPRCLACGGAPAAWETEDGRTFCAGCVSCKCGQPDCILTNPPAPTDARPDTPSGRPDTGSGSADTGVRTSGTDRAVLELTSTDTVRTPDPDTASGRPDTGPDPMPRAGLRAALAELADLPPDLLGDTRCECGQDSPLILVSPDGGHWHMDPAEHEKLQSGRTDLHPAVAAWGQCWDRAENMRTRLALARQVLIDEGYFTEDEVGDDIAPRMIEWLSAHRARVWELTRVLDEVLSHFLPSDLIDSQPHLRTGNVDARELAAWRQTLNRVRTNVTPRYTGECPRPECSDAREDVITASGAYEVLRTRLIGAGQYITAQQSAGFPLRGGDNRYRVLSFLAACNTDPGPLKLRTVGQLP